MTNKQNKNNAGGGELGLDLEALITHLEEELTSSNGDVSEEDLTVVDDDTQVNIGDREEARAELEEAGLTRISQLKSNLLCLVANAKEPTSFEIRTEVTTYVIPRNKTEEGTSLRIALFNKNVKLVRDYNINTRDEEEAREVLKELGLQDISKPDQELLMLEQDVGEARSLKKGKDQEAEKWLTEHYGESAVPMKMPRSSYVSNPMVSNLNEMINTPRSR